MAGDRYELSGLAIPEGLDRLLDLLAVVGGDHPDIDQQDLMLFSTAVIEIAGNVVEHGRPVGAVAWHLVLEVRPDVLEATLSDGGEEYAGLPEGWADLPDPWAESGRGLALAAAGLDELGFERRDGRNTWHLVRARTRAD